MTEAERPSLIGLSALITGGTRGLGEVMARAILEAGASVLVIATDLARVEEFVASTRGRALGLRAEAVVNYANEHLGGLDVLVNNAGINLRTIRKSDSPSPSAPFFEIGPLAFRRFFEVNVFGAFLLSRAVVGGMLQRGYGRIITVTTSLDTMTRAGAVPYGTMKAAGEAFTAAMAHDLKETPVTANVLIPGGAAATRMVGDQQPMRGALIDPAVMAAPAVWLASRESEGVRAMRFTASAWDTSLSPAEAARRAGRPIAWPSDREGASG